ncbi:MAG TPA: GtrA family protein [Candidatus Aphodomonas merdavium]|nr:GtrA family protein [Candidatus Aphodomonas merdavium]
MWSKIKALYLRYRPLFWYLVTGGITTVTNIAVFWALNVPLGVHYQTANIIAWVIAVAVAFLGNKFLAFCSKEKGKGLLREAARFLLMRLLTLGFDAAFLYAAIDLCGIGAMAAKVVDNVIVIILNYVLSKLFVFKRKG